MLNFLKLYVIYDFTCLHEIDCYFPNDDKDFVFYFPILYEHIALKEQKE